MLVNHFQWTFAFYSDSPFLEACRLEGMIESSEKAEDKGHESTTTPDKEHSISSFPFRQHI
jgi:hypothetical protein